MALDQCVLWLCLLSLASAGAPGDGDAVCADSTLAIVGVAAPLPSNVGTLMDSYDYLTLLAPSGAVWQQVDLDNNNLPGVTTTVSVE